MRQPATKGNMKRDKLGDKVGDKLGQDDGIQGETRPPEGGHTIQHRHTCGETMGDNGWQGETRHAEGGHTISDRHTCGETMRNNSRQWRTRPSRRKGVHFFNILTSKNCSEPEVSLAFWLWNVLRTTISCNFWSYHLPRWLRTRRFSKPTFRPSGATKHWKKTHCFMTFLPFARIDLRSSDSFFCLPLPTSAASSVHIVESLSSKLLSILIIIDICRRRCRLLWLQAAAAEGAAVRVPCPLSSFIPVAHAVLLSECSVRFGSWVLVPLPSAAAGWCDRSVVCFRKSVRALPTNTFCFLGSMLAFF